MFLSPAPPRPIHVSGNSRSNLPELSSHSGRCFIMHEHSYIVAGICAVSNRNYEGNGHFKASVT